MRKFKLIKDYYDKNVKLYKKGSITLETGLTVLVGCNGAGKTTLLRQIKHTLEKDNIKYVSFDNLRNGGSYAREKAGFYGDMTFLATSILSSEGENISMNMGNFARQIGKYCRDTDQNELWVIMDAVDSGLSVDAIVDIKECLFNTIFEANPNKDIYIIVSANEYEMARDEKCFDVIQGKYTSIKSYDEYRNIILKSREEKDKRYNQEVQ